MCAQDSEMRGMELVRPGSMAKTLSSVARNTSCSRGWLRLLVQSIFATVTVASFILIVLMTIPRWSNGNPPERPPRCVTNYCRIECRETPFFGEFEDDIIHAVSAVEENCQSIFLTLNNPMFINNAMPPKWLSSLRTNIHELIIMNGNLMHVPSNAFMSQYAAGVRVLVFQNLLLRTWTADSLVGLSNLRMLYVKDSIIVNVPRDALRAVDDTLQSLTITRSEHWDPTNVTGLTTFSQLLVVDFSSNDFKDVIGRSSFNGLQKCKVLYLNSCRITSIGLGAFDNLHSIELIFLQNNHLVTIPEGLFMNVVTITDPKPRINLQDNLWHCDCSAKELRQLLNKDLLLTDPVCESPEYFKDKTFSDLEAYCLKNNDPVYVKRILNTTISRWWDNLEDIYGFVYVSSECFNGNEFVSNTGLKIYSPVRDHECPSDVFEKGAVNILSSFVNNNSGTQILPQNGWIKFTYFLKTYSYSMVQVGALESDDYGVVWYQSTCPNEVYCVSDVPSILRIYNIDLSAHYVFCPVFLKTGKIQRENCVYYDNARFDLEEAYYKLQILLYIGIGTINLIIGAICVYALVRKHPYLLKGSKRILFVKNKSVDALVLPPKVPLRNDLINESSTSDNGKNIFTMPSNHLHPNRFDRNLSTRSSKSSSPSYISALQPTEDQLAEWRIRCHFSNDLSLTPSKSDVSTFSWVSSNDAQYYSLDIDNDKTYESLK